MLVVNFLLAFRSHRLLETTSFVNCSMENAGALRKHMIKIRSWSGIGKYQIDASTGIRNILLRHPSRKKDEIIVVMLDISH